MYQYLSGKIQTEFQPVKNLRDSEKGMVEVVLHKKSGLRFVVRRFTGSAEIYKKLIKVKSPCLPQIMEAAEQDGKVLVIEEYIVGDPLDQLMEGAVLTPGETKRIILDVCKGLYILHSLNIVHRDVKPSNIILRGDKAVLLDFDASRTVKTDQAADTVTLGTTGYAPPEQYGIGQTDPRADIYALGITMNQMLTGEHPSVKMAAGKYGRMIAKCINVDPNKRYRNIKSFMEALVL